MTIFKHIFNAAFIFVFASCGHKAGNSLPQHIVEPVSHCPYAELRVPQTVDLGIFQGEDMKHSVTIALTNLGNDTLVILKVLPDCDCVEVERYDSLVAPGQHGCLTTSLNLTDYPADTIYKELGILSNSRSGNVTRITLFGLKQ